MSNTIPEACNEHDSRKQSAIKANSNETFPGFQHQVFCTVEPNLRWRYRLADSHRENAGWRESSLATSRFALGFSLIFHSLWKSINVNGSEEVISTSWTDYWLQMDEEETDGKWCTPSHNIQPTSNEFCIIKHTDTILRHHHWTQRDVCLVIAQEEWGQSVPDTHPQTRGQPLCAHWKHI